MMTQYARQDLSGTSITQRLASMVGTYTAIALFLVSPDDLETQVPTSEYVVFGLENTFSSCSLVLFGSL